MQEIQDPLFEVQPTREELMAEFERLRLSELEISKAAFEKGAAKSAIMDLLYVPSDNPENDAFSSK